MIIKWFKLVNITVKEIEQIKETRHYNTVIYYIPRIYNLINKYFEIEEKSLKNSLHVRRAKCRTKLWFNINNPELQDCSPLHMILIGRGKYVYEKVKQAIKETKLS